MPPTVYIQFESIRLEFDADKSARNAQERGLPFDRAALFEFGTAYVWPDVRRDYGEERWSALGFVADRLHAISFARRGDRLRIISMRKANDREKIFYDRKRRASAAH